MIKKNKSKLFLIILIMILVLIIGIIAVVDPTKYASFIYRNGIIMFIVGLLGIVVSIYFIYEFGKKLFNTEAIFLINNEGMSDQVNILDYPFIYWNDILKIEECRINNVPHLKIFISNPQQYINQKKGLKKRVLNFNYENHQTPILFNSTYLSCSFDHFRKDILDSYTLHK